MCVWHLANTIYFKVLFNQKNKMWCPGCPTKVNVPLYIFKRQKYMRFIPLFIYLFCWLEFSGPVPITDSKIIIIIIIINKTWFINKILSFHWNWEAASANGFSISLTLCGESQNMRNFLLLCCCVYFYECAFLYILLLKQTCISSYSN